MNDHVKALMGARLALLEAVDMLCFWGDFADEYAQARYNLRGDIDRIDAAIEDITREIGL